jgi:uncharacterized membrane protein (UPF0127 family)
MRVLNVATGQVLAERAQVARGIRRRLVGLLDRERFDDGEALVLPRCSAIHTCFMRFAIDVIFVKRGKALQVIRSLQPFRIAWIPGADTVIELPAGAIAKAPTQPGELLVTEGVTCRKEP